MNWANPLPKITLLLLLTLSTTSTFAQTYIAGKVTDETGLGLPGATVYIEGTTIGASSNINGEYLIKEVEVGTYNLIASFIGYETQTIFNVSIKSTGNQAYNFQLNDATTKLNEVVVKIDKNVISRPKESPLSANRLTATELATYPGGNNDVVRVAQSLPGISPSAGGFRNDLIIRGGAPNETVYYLDGMEIPNINHFSTQGSSGGPVGMLNVSFIEDVTLSTSAFGAKYDNPLSGVLQFNQRTGNARELNTNVRVSASETALTMEGPLFKREDDEPSKTTFLISGRRSYLQYLFDLIGLPIRPDYWDYQFKITHKINEYNTLNFLGLGSIDDFTLAPADESDTTFSPVRDQAPFIKQRSNTMGISWKKRFTNRVGFMETVVSNNFLKNKFTRYTDSESKSGVYFQNDSKEQETKLRHIQRYFFEGYKLSAGFNVQHSAYTNATSATFPPINYTTSINFIKYGLFADVNKDVLNKKLNVNFGVRVDTDTYTSGTSLLETFSPRLSLSYSLSDSWKINSTLGRFYKIPPYTILGYQENKVFVNKNAKYTESNHLVLGVEHLFGPASSVSIEGFYKLYNDYPVSINDSVSLANKGAGFEVLGNENVETVGKGRSYGLEFLLQQKLSKNFYGILSYTFYVSEFTGFNNSEFLPSLWDSRHLASFTGGYKFKNNWEFSSRFRFAGKTPFVPTNESLTAITYPNVILDYSKLGDEKLGVFAALDIRLDKKWNFKRFALDVFIEAQNVLGRANPQAPEYGLMLDNNGAPTNPRQLFQVAEQEGSVIPSIGIVLDF